LENIRIKLMNTQMEYHIKPQKRISLNLKEIWQYKELFYFFTWRDIKVKYKQTFIGFLWAILMLLKIRLMYYLISASRSANLLIKK